jgi:hypothetical protein
VKADAAPRTAMTAEHFTMQTEVSGQSSWQLENVPTLLGQHGMSSMMSAAISDIKSVGDCTSAVARSLAATSGPSSSPTIAMSGSKCLSERPIFIRYVMSQAQPV